MIRLLFTGFLLFTALFPTAFAQQTTFVNAQVPASSLPPALAPETLSPPFVPDHSSAIAVVPVPRSEAKPTLALQDWTLLGATATFRFFDYKSTVRCVSDPIDCKEIQLPAALVHNKPALAAFEASTVVGNYYIDRFLIRRDHRKLARVGQSIYTGVMAFTIGHNYYEIDELWPRGSLPVRHGNHGSSPGGVANER